ncbi:ankyrin repeat domain-containing protein 27-like [Trichogramma pretiosum]|uniref:ankyrin repeat domain-containing protein 27-like n=1 Tax=Trichogramma pretiosum TaxID=7493 RepID=UPI0006C96D87|nr:ankyrin repeat domain-containing protein 27-like [Trichogramma pretiosum]
MADDTQNRSSKLKDMPEKYRQIKDESHEFIRKLYTFTRDYQGQLLKYNGIELEPLVDFLIKTGCKDEFDVNYAADSGVTHFHLACWFDCVDAVKEFLEAGQDPNCIASEEGTRLHFALAFEQKEIAKLLLKHDASPNLADAEGRTPVHVVCKEAWELLDDGGLLEMVFEICNENQQLLQIDAQDKLGNTPLHFALIRKDRKLIELLLRNGANPNLANAEGSTFLHVCCQDRHDDYDALDVFFEVTDDVQQSVQIDDRDKLGRTPLHLCGAVGVAEQLKNRGYDLDRCDVRTIMKFFAKHGLFKKVIDLKKCWYDALGALHCESVRDDVKKIFPGLGARLFLGVDTRLTTGSLLRYDRQEAKE